MYKVGKRNFASEESYQNWKRNKKIAANRPEVKKKNSEARKDYWAIEANRDNASKERLERWANPEYKEKVSVTHKERWKDAEFRRKQKEADIRFWTSPETEERRTDLLLKIHKGKYLRPNHFETKYIDLFEVWFPGEFQYTGGGKDAKAIGSKFPDFIHKSKPKIIELFGVYWHEPEEVEIRTTYFESYGYETLVIWEDEDVSDALKRVKEFIE